MQTLILSASFFLFSSSLVAQDALPETPEEIRDDWGAVKYCRSVYTEPAISGRIYPADTQACTDADALMRRIVHRYAEESRLMLEQEADKKAQVIRYNTPDVQEAVRACRLECERLSRRYNELYPQVIQEPASR